MKSHFFIFSATFCLLGAFFSHAQQQGKKYKKEGLIQLNDSLTNYSQSDIFDFPNISTISLFQDADKLKRIRQLRNGRNDKELYQTLREYVKNFGIENFAFQTSMIWDLARLSEKYGPPGEAILLYKLVLKHHRQDIDGKKVLSEFDSLTKLEKDYYVPLEHYYDLIEFRKEVDTLRPPHGVLLNIGEWVNSMREDYGPTIGNLDSILLFTSKRNRHLNATERRFDEDLFFTVKVNDVWMEAAEFKNINTMYNEGSACLSNDGKILYFARCNSPESMGSCDLFIAELKADSSWGDVRNLGPNINTVAWESHPSLSRSGDTLFFTSDRLGGFGMTDIYYAVKDREGYWQKAKNIGPIINTKNNEASPFFHHKYNVLYFSSNGQPLNFGDFDIYKSFRYGDVWGEPKNIGPLVNGPGTEYYFTIDSKSEHLYYARSLHEDINNLDLHSFPVPMEAKPDATAVLKGSLVDSETGTPFKGIVSIIDLDHGVEVAPKFLRPDGSFDFTLINKRNYLLIIQGENFFRIEEIFYLDGNMEINKETEPIAPKIAFQSVEFENGKADILPEMHADLNKVANFMIDNPQFTITISGHTDSQGSEDSNLRLSQARADAIKAYLVYEFKIESSRITAYGYGSSKPIIEAEVTDNDRRLNRRVEFELSSHQ